MTLRFIRKKKSTGQLETQLVNQAEKLSANPGDIKTALDLFLALSIFKCTIEPTYRGNADLVQVNLIKRGLVTGVRIFRVGKTDTAHVLHYHHK
jgi:hypothetical protein